MTDAYQCDNCNRYFSKADFLSPVKKITYTEVSRYSTGYMMGTGRKDWTQETEMWCNVCKAIILDRHA